MAVIVPNAIARPMAAVTDNRNHNGPEVPRVDIKTPGNLARSSTDAKYNNGKIYNLKKKSVGGKTNRSNRGFNYMTWANLNQPVCVAVSCNLFKGLQKRSYTK